MAKKDFETLVLEKLGLLDQLVVDVSGLKTDVSGLKTDVSELKVSVSLLETNVSNLNDKVNILDNRTFIMDKKIDGLYDKNSDLEDAITLNTRYINQSFKNQTHCA